MDKSHFMITKILTIVMLLIATVACSPPSEELILGKWESSAPNNKYVKYIWEFLKDGTYSSTTIPPSSFPFYKSGNWSIHGDEMTTIVNDKEGKSSTTIWAFSFPDKDTLTTTLKKNDDWSLTWARISESADPLPHEIFKELKSLVDYSREPSDQSPYVAKRNLNFATDLYLLREEIRLKGCTLAKEEHWRTASSTRAVDPSTPSKKQKVMSYLWVIPLDKIDAKKTNALRESKIVLRRDSTFTHSEFHNKKGWSQIKDLQSAEDFFQGGYSASNTAAGAISTMGLAAVAKAMGVESRSGTFSLGYAYPEDQPEIQKAFGQLVDACNVSTETVN